MNWLFIIIILVFALCIIRGYNKGLLMIAYSMVSWIVIFAIVSWATPHINDYIKNNTSIYSMIMQQCEEKLKQSAQDQMDITAQTQTKQLESIGISLPAPLLEDVLQMTTDTADTFLQESGIYTQAAAGLADLAVKGISSLFAWLFASLIVSIIARLLGIVSKIPVVRGVNRYMGVAAGALYALMLVWTAFCVIALCGGSDYGIALISYIYENPLLAALYENNLVLFFLFHFI